MSFYFFSECISDEEFINKMKSQKQETINNSFNHEYTDEIVCPHCGYAHKDSWEWSDGKHECSDCGESFVMVRNITVSYTTEKCDEL